MFIIGGFNAGVSFCSEEAYHNSEIIIVGENYLFDTKKKEFIPTKYDYDFSLDNDDEDEELF